MNSPKGVKSGVPEICGTCHNLLKITGNQSYVTVSEQTIQDTCRSVDEFTTFDIFRWVNNVFAYFVKTLAYYCVIWS